MKKFFSLIMALFLVTVAMILIPSLALAADEGGSSFPWATIISIVLGLIAALAAGAWMKFKIAISQSQHFLEILSQAIEDNKITEAEAAAIIVSITDATKSWGDAVTELLKLFRKKSE